tara:strand:- start:950 stop:1093 length:144 start_codon:yes stop_codon:yes gene_type:complete
LDGELFILFLGAKIWEVSKKVQDGGIFVYEGDGRPTVWWWEDEVVGI